MTLGLKCAPEMLIPNSVRIHIAMNMDVNRPAIMKKNIVKNAVPINSMTNLERLTQKYCFADKFELVALRLVGDVGGDIVSYSCILTKMRLSCSSTALVGTFA